MELEEAIKNIKEQIHNENGEHWNYIDIDNFYDDECENFICSIETVLNHLTKQEKMIKLMVEKYNDDFGDIGDFCQHEYCSKDYNCKKCIKQYFEKKAEESE